MSVRAIDIVTKFAPSAKQAYRDAFAQGDAQLTAAEITTPLRLTHFMAQCAHETGGFVHLVESGKYSAKALGQMWDSGNWHRYFANRAGCVKMADACATDGGMALFSLVYGGRMGNGSPATKDGWTYRGRGVLQTTGRDSYRRFGRMCGVDFEGNPDLVVTAAHVLKPALAEWTAKNLNAAADENDIEVITLGINGGRIGIDERRAWFARIWPFVIGDPPVEHSTEWKVQAALAKLGYDCGNPDGVVGPRTRAAILRYRGDKGLPPTSAIDLKLKTALGL